ncbi:MAG TPA: flagellar protein FlgN [Tepidanaerobacter syntrophicus]|uniref:flagellar export chaperone FlgN n=1 Tax=Tepidanaerobacter syntrophicus TaxID=224999 RepID=UPI00176924D3|nr:flagellar export chaperone FlgN [Tepidanaerobacter syntrophicus]HHV82399.1 flagellar protein FlgN [Tepidanaerobacter syntrophicus]
MEKDVLKLLEDKLNYMKKLYDSTEEISGALQKDDAEGLLNVISDRQQLISEISFTDSRLSALFKGDIAAMKEYILNSSNSKIRQSYNAIGEWLRKIKKLDDENRSSIEKMFLKLKDDLENLNSMKSALKGYGVIEKASHNGAFIDTKK